MGTSEFKLDLFRMSYALQLDESKQKMASDTRRRSGGSIHSENKTRQSSTSSEPDKIMECPICCDTMSTPIIQCEAGHPMCQSCVRDNAVNKCPICRGPMTDRRMYPLEQLIESLKDKLKISCCYSAKGCKFSLPMKEKEYHEQECRHRRYKCEGTSFGIWKCDWAGEYLDLEKHFKEFHPNHTSMQFRTKAAVKVNLRNDYKDIQLISFFNGSSYFYYKFKVDVQTQKLFWAIQYVGLKTCAKNYYYEFEISTGNIKKFKVTEFCENDTIKAEHIFKKENCVVMPFAMAENFLNPQKELLINFRIMAMKKQI